MDYLKLPLAERRARYIKKVDPNSCLLAYKSLKGVIHSALNSMDEHHGNKVWKLGSTDCQYVEEPERIFRGIAFHDDVRRSRHTGWYVDDTQSETTIGVVCTMTHGRFAAACTDPWNFDDKKCSGPVIIEYGVSYDTKEEAARAADQLAEQYGEMCREDNAKQRAEADIEELHTEITGLREEIVALVQAIRRSTLDPVVCERLKADIAGLFGEKTSKYKRIEKLQDNFWNAVEN